MGRFDEDYRDYEQYSDAESYRKTVPHGLPDAVAEVISAISFSDDEGTRVLTDVANGLLSMAGAKATQNWEVEPLRAEIRSACIILGDGAFAKFMDGVLNAANRVHRQQANASDVGVTENLNEVFATANFGYRLRLIPASNRHIWQLQSEAHSAVAAIAEAAHALTDMCPEAIEHLQQARAHLATPDKSRSRKDAVRDAMSAVEAFLKFLAAETDVDRASKKLRAQGIWGHDQIVKEGHSTWGQLHNLYPDLRHGQPGSGDLDLEEATYWIDRMTTYVKYMAAKKRLVGM